jgi:hypothetical protein
MNGTGDNHVKHNKPDLERQIRHVLSYMWYLDSMEKYGHEQNWRPTCRGATSKRWKGGKEKVNKGVYN